MSSKLRDEQELKIYRYLSIPNLLSFSEMTRGWNIAAQSLSSAQLFAPPWTVAR